MGSTFIIFLVVLPNLDLLLGLFKPPSDVWLHIKEWLLFSYIKASVLVVVFTVLFSATISMLLAWFMSAYTFPGKNFLSWALILPLSIPPYIGAYTYSGMLGYTGTIPVFMRNFLSIDVSIDIMSIGGAIFIFTFFLFPYSYLITKSFWQKQSASLIESSRMLGFSPVKTFFFLVLPMSRVALVSGSTLIALEVLSDYGVVSYFGVPTFSAAIFRSWTSYGDLHSALKLSALLLAGIIFILSLERVARGQKRFSFSTSKVRPLQPKKMKGWSSFLMSGFAWFIFTISFIVPFIQLVFWSLVSYQNIYYFNFTTMVRNSFLLALTVSFIILIASLIIANFIRLYSGWFARIYQQLAVIGYAIPGTVLAISMILLLSDLHLQGQFYLGIGLLVALVIRYLAVGFQSIQTGFEKTGKSFSEVSRTLGRGTYSTFLWIDIPLLLPSIATAFAFVFLDVMKELPIILLLRPFNFYTLSTRVFDYANDEMIPESSLPSLTIILMSVLVMLVVSRLEKVDWQTIGKNKKEEKKELEN